MDEQILAISKEENTRNTEISWFSHSPLLSLLFLLSPLSSPLSSLLSPLKRQEIESECSLMWDNERGLLKGSVSHKQLTGHFSMNGMLLYLKICHSDFQVHLYLSPKKHLIIAIWYCTVAKCSLSI